MYSPRPLPANKQGVKLYCHHQYIKFNFIFDTRFCHGQSFPTDQTQMTCLGHYIKNLTEGLFP